MAFDKLYVLAKGGFCIFSGPPQKLAFHLNECDITCNQFQLPIEVLLKHSSSFNYEIVEKLAKNTSKENQMIFSRCECETILIPDGIQFRSKRFKLIDLWLLFSRNMIHTYRYFWKHLLMQFISYLIFGYIPSIIFRPDIGKPSGCINFEENFNSTCNKTADKIEEESLLTQNITYNLFVAIILIFLQCIATTINISQGIKIFFNEHRNGMDKNLDFFSLKFMKFKIKLLILI
jgi:hypothetical protein